MTTKVESTITVEVPVRTAYDQWTQFEQFPRFMGGVIEVQQLDDRNLHWVAEIAGVRREWDATILEQVPDTKVAWAATQGATNAGAIYFVPVDAGRTTVRLSLEYEPTGLLEHLADKLDLVERQATSDLERFKAFIEGEGAPTGAWRGSVNEGAHVAPGVEAARGTEGDSGKAGISPKAVVAGAAVAAAGAVAARALKGDGGDAAAPERDTPDVPPAADVTVVEEVAVVEAVEPLPAVEPVAVVDVVEVAPDVTTDRPLGGPGSGTAR